MRTLHPAYRVTDLDASVGFYTALGYGQVGRVELGGGGTLTMLKVPSEGVVGLGLVPPPPPPKPPSEGCVALELEHRPADGKVEIGTGFSHLAIQTDNLRATVEA